MRNVEIRISRAVSVAPRPPIEGTETDELYTFCPSVDRTEAERGPGAFV